MNWTKQQIGDAVETWLDMQPDAGLCLLRAVTAKFARDIESGTIRIKGCGDDDRLADLMVYTSDPELAAKILAVIDEHEDSNTE